MSVYKTNLSNLTNISLKERKAIESNFPFTIPSNSLDLIDICGQKVDKTDISIITKFCPICDHPVIVRMLYLPCEHMTCYSCSKPESDQCHVCSSKIQQIKRISDKSKLYECDYPDCLRFFDSFDKLFNHSKMTHGIQFDFLTNSIIS